MVIPKRYVVRMLNIPNTLTQRIFENELTQHKMKYNKLYFASHDGKTSAGFAFIEFNSMNEMEVFKMHFDNINEDILYSNGKMSSNKLQ
jgi:late competence protein required for DNA uptake (superfamily II DNA/RNA helicase)